MARKLMELFDAIGVEAAPVRTLEPGKRLPLPTPNGHWSPDAWLLLRRMQMADRDALLLAEGVSVSASEMRKKGRPGQ